MALNATTTIGVGFGTAALGSNTYSVVTMALAAGFRKFDTAEADWWYDQKNVGRAVKDYFSTLREDDDIRCEGLKISTKMYEQNSCTIFPNVYLAAYLCLYILTSLSSPNHDDFLLNVNQPSLELRKY